MATLALAANVESKLVQDMLGHSSMLPEVREFVRLVIGQWGMTISCRAWWQANWSLTHCDTRPSRTAT
ncbi:hypothetical protein [Actinomadura pelletieri]|uniref:hypothetical protein n=1 Tax=Actinomadura pelletieri TaxID=111805 RepID=UPI000EB44742|nr:hypothetical protein [Actinomadura pelletieri]